MNTATADATTTITTATATAIAKGAEMIMGHSHYGTSTMQVWLATTCPKTMIANLGCWTQAMPKAASVWLDLSALGVETDCYEDPSCAVFGLCMNEHKNTWHGTWDLKP